MRKSLISVLSAVIGVGALAALGLSAVAAWIGPPF